MGYEDVSCYYYNAGWFDMLLNFEIYNEIGTFCKKWFLLGNKCVIIKCFGNKKRGNNGVIYHEIEEGVKEYEV